MAAMEAKRHAAEAKYEAAYALSMCCSYTFDSNDWLDLLAVETASKASGRVLRIFCLLAG